MIVDNIHDRHTEGRPHDRAAVVTLTTRKRRVAKPTEKVMRSGVYFDFAEPDPATIHIEDIAWHLASIERFGGACPEGYTVAQHCVLASRLVPEEDQLEALMHDAAEAYTGDMVAPLKRLCPDFKAVEHRVEAAVAVRFGLRHPWPPSVKEADIRMLRSEQLDVSVKPHDDWGFDHVQATPFVIRPLPKLAAARAFLARFDELHLWRLAA